jgi:peptide/nickel transport system permease protein
VYVAGLSTLLLFGSHIGRIADLGIPLTYTPFGDSPGRWLESMIVPWLVLGFPLAGAALRVMRAQAVEVSQEDYLRTARAKGLSEPGVFRHHVLRPAVAPVLSMAGATANLTLLNMVLVEKAFSIPGVFQHLGGAMDNGDFAILFALTIEGAVIVCAANLAADLALMAVDPRLRGAATAS